MNATLKPQTLVSHGYSFDRKVDMGTYFESIKQFSLLTGDEEKNLYRQLESCHDQMAEIIFRSLGVVDQLLNLSGRFENNEIAFSELSNLGSDGQTGGSGGVREQFTRKIKLILGISFQIKKLNQRARNLSQKTKKFKLHQQKVLILENDLVKLCGSLKLNNEVMENLNAQYHDENGNKSTAETSIRKLKDIIHAQESIRKQLVVSNLRLVIMVAKKYVSRKNDLSDLVQEGNLGLLKAIDLFNYRTGFKFSTYATWWIKQAITRYLAEKSKTIRIPSNILERNRSIFKFTQSFVQKNGRSPDTREISKGMRLKEDKILQSFSHSSDPLSLDSPLSIPDEPLINSVEDTSSEIPEAYFEENELLGNIEDALEKLSNKEKWVIIHRYGLFNQKAETLREIGEQLLISRERVRQLENKALFKLKSVKFITQHAFA